jgi:hypothetical protein
MNLRRTANRSRVVSLTRRIRDRLASQLKPVTHRLTAVDRALLRVVRGSRLHRWLTAETDPGPIVIDLRETYTVGSMLGFLERVSALVGASRLVAVATETGSRIVESPARAAGAVLCLTFSASLLATMVTGDLTTPVYLFHMLGLGLGLVTFRERRELEALAESPVWGALLAVFAPPPTPNKEPSDGD